MNFNQNNGWQMKKNIPNAPMDPQAKKKIKSIALLAVIIIFVIVLISSSYYTVSDKQQAVITTFDKFTGVTEAGLHFKIPFIQQATLVNVNVSLSQTIGYDPNTNAAIPNECKMITGDFNIVNVDFYMEYRISDPYKYLYNSEEPEKILKNIAQSKIRNVISTYRVDDILTTGKAEIQGKIKDLIIEELTVYDIGVELYDIKIQDAVPPTPEVVAAFKSVETAKQDRLTARNQATAYGNENIPKAQADADQLLQNAAFLKQNRINDAVMQIAMFEAMYNEYILNPNINKQRMYYEMIEKVLPGVKVYINAGQNDNMSMLLPLDGFTTANNP